jgi:predicted N-formylglutamate amidohydrolase
VNNRSIGTLLGPDDPSPYTVYCPDGASPYVFIADHAGRRIPAALNGLGLTPEEIDRHIGWDIGIAGVAERLAHAMNAFTIAQTYSRLVIDCNRPLTSPSSIAEVSDGTVIPGNQRLDLEQRTVRALEIFAPYHARIVQELDRRANSFQPTILVTLHSFTPILDTKERPWHCGVLYQRDSRFAHAMLAALRQEPDLAVGDNQPYFVTDATDYAIPIHGEGRGLPHVELEIRQDLIASDDGQQIWTARLMRIFDRLAPAFLSN